MLRHIACYPKPKVGVSRWRPIARTVDSVACDWWGRTPPAAAHPPSGGAGGGPPAEVPALSDLLSPQEMLAAESLEMSGRPRCLTT